jgi:hypothetical protein
MSCLLNGGLTKESCQFLIGGVSNIYLANKEELISFNDGNSDNIYDSITMSSTASVFYKFETSKNTSSYTQVLTVSGANKFIQQTVDFIVGRNDQDTFDLLEKLALGNFVAIVETRMGKKIVLGETNGLEATVANANSGVAEGDSAGIQVTLVGSELGYGHIYEGTIPQ